MIWAGYGFIAHPHLSQSSTTFNATSIFHQSCAWLRTDARTRTRFSLAIDEIKSATSVPGNICSPREKSINVKVIIFHPMLNILQLSESQIYVESDRWQCSFGHGMPVKLGLVLEAADLDEEDENAFSIVINASLLPQPECIDEEILEEARSEGLETREEQIRFAYESYGGVPVNIDAVQPPKASCGFSGFVADSVIRSTEIVGTGESMETRHFQDLEEAMSFARDFYAIYAPVIFGFIDVVLDHPMRFGGTGWDRISQMARR